MIHITPEALNIIKQALCPDKMPRIVLHNGGCAGHMLVLTLDKKSESDVLVESNGISFAVELPAEQYIEDITICVQNNLGTNIIIKNNKFLNCRCGKSFKA